MDTHDLSCRDLDEFLMDYLDERLEAGPRERFERHLGTCPACVTYLASYRDTVRVARTCERDPKLEDVPQALIDAVLAARKQQA